MSGKPENSDGEDWGRDQEDDEDDEEDDDEDDDADEDYEAPGNHQSPAAGGSQASAPTEWTCPQCQTTFSDNDDYLSHVKMEHGKVCLGGGCSLDPVARNSLDFLCAACRI